MILVTGATGFVGNAVLQRLRLDDPSQSVAVAVRAQHHGEWPQGVLPRPLGDLGGSPLDGTLFEGVSAVVHCAGRAHIMRDTASAPLVEFRRVNVEGTLQLARLAAQAGVKRFVYISSVKVNGERTQPGQAFGADDIAQPEDAYGISKMEAEQGLRTLAEQTGMEWVVIRPPLVYGPGVKANFASLMRWVQRGIPLPLGAVHNRRSLVALDNLVDLIVLCTSHPAAARQTFMVSDGEDISTADLVRRMAKAAGRPAHLIPLPVWMLRALGQAAGRPHAIERLCGNLQVDIRKTRELLGWQARVTLDQGLQKAMQAVQAM